MAKLNYYIGQDSVEYIAIITDKSFEKEMSEDSSLRLAESVEIGEDDKFIAFPTDRLLAQE